MFWQKRKVEKEKQCPTCQRQYIKAVHDLLSNYKGVVSANDALDYEYSVKGLTELRQQINELRQEFKTEEVIGVF